MSYRWFVYGAALDDGWLAGWCRSRGLPEALVADAQPAVLDDWELVLAVPSETWGGAVGALRPHPGGLVYGALATLPDEHADAARVVEQETAPDARELDVELRLWTPVEDEATIQLVQARAFGAPPVAAPGAPSARWLDAVRRGAAAHGLPAAWLAALAGLGRPGA